MQSIRICRLISIDCASASPKPVPLAGQLPGQPLGQIQLKCLPLQDEGALRQPWGEGLGSSLDRGVALEACRLQRSIARQRELIHLF